MKKTKQLIGILIIILFNLQIPKKGYSEDLPPELLQLILHTPSVINERDLEDLKTWIKKVESGVNQHLNYNNIEFGWENHLSIAAPYKHHDLNLDTIECGQYLSLDILNNALLNLLKELIGNHRRILEASSSLSFETTLKIIRLLSDEFEIISEISKYIESKKTKDEKKLVHFYWPLDYSKILKRNLDQNNITVISSKISNLQYKGAKWEENQIPFLPVDLFKELPKMNSSQTSIDASLWVDTVQFCSSKHLLKVKVDLQTKIESQREDTSIELVGLPISTQSQKSFSLAQFIHQTEDVLARSQTFCASTTSSTSELFKCLLIQNFKTKSILSFDSPEFRNQSWMESTKQYFVRTQNSNTQELNLINRLIKLSALSCKKDFLKSLSSETERNLFILMIEDKEVNFERFICPMTEN